MRVQHLFYSTNVERQTLHRRITPTEAQRAQQQERWQDVGHYSQMIWRGTRRVGCALGDGANYEYLVCRYFPAGNAFGKGPLDADATIELASGGQ